MQWTLMGFDNIILGTTTTHNVPKNWTWNWEHSREQSKFTWFGGLNVWYHILSCKPHKKARGFKNGYQQKVLLKGELMDSLSEKIIALDWKVGMRAEGGEKESGERLMGNDNSLSRHSGCPEKCEARVLRWQRRAGCQSGKVALIPWKAKESDCQPCSATLKVGENMA